MPDLESILDAWPFLRNREPEIWAMFSHALKERGRDDCAATLALAVLRRPDCTGRAHAMARPIVAGDVPKWHWPMIRDSARNAAYDDALRRAVGPGSHVLDIGAGSGLLAMMSARAGAERVVACEMVPAVAAVAQEIIRHNGFDQRIRVVPKHSRDVAVGIDLDRPADVIVSEIVDNSLLGEGVLPTHADAVRRLLRPGGRVIPAAGSILVALGFAPKLAARRMATHQGFDLSPFNVLDKPFLRAHVGRDEVRFLSDDASLFRFAFGEPDQWPGADAEVTVTARAGTANAVVQWIRLDMDDSGGPGAAIDSRPGVDRHSTWASVLWPLREPVTWRGGETVRIAGRRTDTTVTIWLEG